MITISDKSLCCGCTACMNVCPSQCIVMRRDREGFDYPVANPDRCVGCGLCERICPVLNPRDVSEPLSAYAARSEEFLKGSSSGGVFPSLAGKVIADGGVVYGAVVNEDVTVGHADAEDMAAVERMRGSKYVQSDLYGTFEEIGYYLSEGRKVLFTGTPCQVAGLKAYLDKDYEGLLTAECACHGVPSPGLWEKYVEAVGRKNGFKVRDVNFRDKSEGWRKYVLAYKGGEREIKAGRDKDPYMLLFLQDMTLRPSCYRCPSRNGRSGADITMADLWDVKAVAPAMDDDRGVSLVLANTEKGLGALDLPGLELNSVEMDKAVRNNGGFAENVAVPERRTEFFKGMHSATDIIRYMKGFVVRKPLPQRLCRGVRSMLAEIKRRMKR